MPKAVKVSHSPLPWKTYGNPLTIDDARGALVLWIKAPLWESPEMERAEANVRLIVRAVNQHQALVTALEDFIDAVESADPGVYRDQIEQARAAITLAKGTDQ